MSAPIEESHSHSEKEKKEFEKMRKEANEAEMTSSPALNNDASTDQGGAGN